MSRLDLDQIQSQLKTAIQNHQVLVARIQLQPQDMGLKTQLHNLQKEIMQMSQKQKLIVQKLRLELIDRQSSSIPPQSSKQLITTAASHSPKLSTSISPSSVSKSSISSQSPSVNSCDEQNQPPAVESCATTPNKPPYSKSCDSTPNHLSSSQKCVTSPIRVPQYPGSRASVLKSSNSFHNNEHKSCKLSKRPHIDRDTWSSKEVHKAAEVSTKDKKLKEKLEFLACLDLVPPDSLKDVQNKRSERKRRSTNNPNFAYGYELERRPRLSNYIGNDYFGAKKPKVRTSKIPDISPASSRPCSPPVSAQAANGESGPHKGGVGHANLCSVCGVSGQLLLCDSCSCVYHFGCLDPPLDRPPEGHWSCPQCQEMRRKSALSLAAVNSYIASKTAKEEEKRKLLKRSTELLQEKTQLENRTKQLNEILARKGIRKHDLIEMNRKAQQSVENLKNFVKAVQSS